MQNPLKVIQMETKTMPLDDAFALLVLTSYKYLAAEWSETSPI